MPTSLSSRIEICVDIETKQLAERAAAASGSSLSEFLVRLIQDKAPQILQEHTNIQLSNQQFDRFIEVCNTQQAVPEHLKQAALLLDKEGF